MPCLIRRDVPQQRDEWANYTSAVVVDTVDNQSEEWRGLWSKRVYDRVHRSSCAFHGAMRNILGCYRRIFRYVPRRANRPGLNAANANSESENN